VTVRQHQPRYVSVSSASPNDAEIELISFSQMD